MTDGILLAEIQRDRDLRRYDTIIIDEAHERSLNIDFLLGYLKQLLPRRPDLKLVITSATIDTARFAAALRRRTRGRGDRAHLPRRGALPPAGRPRPAGRRRERDQVQGVLDAVDELCAEGPGDVLVFLSGEREIRDTADGAARAPDAPARAGRRAPAVRAAVRRGAAPGVRRARRTPGGAGHQRGRDVADGAGHPVRRRRRHRPGVPLQPPAQGAAAADRTRSAARAPTSAPAGADGPPTASASGSTPRPTSTSGRSSPSPRSCAPTSRR